MIDLAGKRFGKLVVLERSHRTPDRVWHWRCGCDCEAIIVVSGKNLKNGNTKSCGCVHGIKISDPITRVQLRRLLSYNPKTGIFRWRVRGRRNAKGAIAGHSNSHNKYVRIGINALQYSAHRLAWFYMTGSWPLEEVDHKNLDKADNRWTNLRLATRTQQQANMGPRGGVLGVKGVSYRRGVYRTTIKGRDVGTFHSLKEAADAYDSAAIKIFGSFARLNEYSA